MNKLIIVLFVFFMFFSFSCGSSDDESPSGSNEETGDQEIYDGDDSGEFVCGNDIIEEGEVCDGNTVSCSEIAGESYVSGMAECLSDCSGYDESECSEDTDSDNEEGAYAVLCWDTYLCVEGCYKEEDPELCEAQCIERASDKARQLYSTMVSCFESNCSGASDMKECVQENCPDEIEACLNHSEPAAPGTCMAIVECQQECSQGDQACMQNCVDQGNEQGKKLYNDYADCAQNCSGDQACINEECKEEQEACLNDK